MGFLNKQEYFAPKNSLAFGYILCLGLIAFCCEIGALGNPFPFSEQQYYLYGGGQILQHQLPYIDFWDRKPVGLFLLFAPIHLFGQYRFEALPLFAAFFMWIGALALMRIAQFLSCRPFPAFLASAVFLIGANAFSDETGGQAEQFYIPLILCAAMLIVKAWTALTLSFSALLKTGIWAMLLLGVALEIKTSCAWDGVFIGISLLIFALTQKNYPFSKRLCHFFLCATIWIFVAALPTLLIMGYYALNHRLPDWIWANITNHHLRSKAIGHSTAFFDYHTYYFNFLKHGLETCFFWGLPIFYFTAHYVCCVCFKNKQGQTITFPQLTPLFFLFIWGWVSLISAIQLRGGYAAVHYTIAAIPASVLLSAYVWQVKKIWGKFFLLLPLCAFTPQALKTNLTSHHAEKKLFQTITPLLNQQQGCLLQLSGAYLFYDLSKGTSTCHVNKFLLSGMLTSPEEQFALGVNREDLLLEDLKKWPLYVVVDSCDERLACNARFKPQVEIKDGLWASNNIPSQKRFDAQEIITKNYVPIYESKNNPQGGDYVLYKLKPGLIPKITPPHMSATPSRLTLNHNTTQKLGANF